MFLGWSLKIYGASNCDVTTSLSAVDSETGYSRAVKGNAVSSTFVTFVIQTTCPEYKPKTLTLLTPQGDPLVNLPPVTSYPGESSEFFTGSVVSDQPVILQISGDDFQRVIPNLWTPTTIKLAFLSGDRSLVYMRPGGVDLSFVATNHGKETGLFTVSAWNGLELKFENQKDDFYAMDVRIEKNATVEIQLELNIPEKYPAGTVVEIQLTVTRNGNAADLNVIRKTVVILSEDVDKIPPKCEELSSDFEEVCDEIAVRKAECRGKTWRARFNLSDSGSGIGSYFVDGVENQENFPLSMSQVVSV